jgi:ribonuclease HI
MMKKHVIIYTDGACEGNPGPGGYGAILIFDGVRKELSQGYRLTTNNRMEMMAAIAALDALAEPCRVTLYSDSRYLVEAMSQGRAAKWQEAGWVRDRGRRVPNEDLWERLLNLCARHEVAFEWVRGHAGDRNNERADYLSYSVISQERLEEDEGYLRARASESDAPSKITEEGQPCRKCATPVVKRIPKRKRKPDQQYYYEYYLYCPGCETMYMVEDAKRYVDENSDRGSTPST